MTSIRAFLLKSTEAFLLTSVAVFLELCKEVEDLKTTGVKRIRLPVEVKEQILKGLFLKKARHLKPVAVWSYS